MEAISVNRRSSAGGPAGILRAGWIVAAGGIVARGTLEVGLVCAALTPAWADADGADDDVDETAT
jgi:hypothetical protein